MLLLLPLGFSGCDRGIDAASCGPNDLLSTNQRGQLVCTARPPVVAPPRCEAVLTSDGRRLSCAFPGAPSEKELAIRGQVAALNNKVVALQARSETPQKTANGYVGLTAMTTNAYLILNNLQGLAAAQRLCDNQYAGGAHMCTMEELYQSVALGVIRATSTIARSWVYAPNWNEPFAMAESAKRGISDTCRNYTDRGSSSRHSSIQVEWGPLPDGSPGFRWRGGSDALCPTAIRIACCR